MRKFPWSRLIVEDLRGFEATNRIAIVDGDSKTIALQERPPFSCKIGPSGEVITSEAWEKMSTEERRAISEETRRRFLDQFA